MSDHEHNPACAICLGETFTDPSSINSCDHRFCFKCIYSWLSSNGTGPPRCPLCKKQCSVITQLESGRQTSCVAKNCEICGRGDDQEPEDEHTGMLRCAGCADRYHLKCLQPRLQRVPDDTWRCVSCVADDAEDTYEPQTDTSESSSSSSESESDLEEEDLSYYNAPPLRRSSRIAALHGN